MITSLLLAATVAADTSVTISRSSRDMELGRTKVTFDLTQMAVRLECKTFKIEVPDLKTDGALFVWTGTLTCNR